jgi:hypothetical protein
MSEYPDSKELEIIKNWSYKDSFLKLMEYVKKLWSWDNYFIQVDDYNFELHTGGWSGNEEIIVALEQNYLFWGLCWQESKRGGNYKFEVRK